MGIKGAYENYSAKVKKLFPRITLGIRGDPLETGNSFKKLHSGFGEFGEGANCAGGRGGHLHKNQNLKGVGEGRRGAQKSNLKGGGWGGRGGNFWRKVRGGGYRGSEGRGEEGEKAGRGGVGEGGAGEGRGEGRGGGGFGQGWQNQKSNLQFGFFSFCQAPSPQKANLGFLQPKTKPPPLQISFLAL